MNMCCLSNLPMLQRTPVAFKKCIDTPEYVIYRQNEIKIFSLPDLPQVSFYIWNFRSFQGETPDSRTRPTTFAPNVR